MVPPTLFISGGMAVLHLCNEVYTRLRSVKRYRKDCEKLARFVHRIEAFITETEDDADMTAPAWQAAFEALNDSLQEVVAVFEGCAKYGMIRSLINADELNLHLNSISQRLMLALQLIPIQKAKATDKRLGELQSIQLEIRNATFAAVHAAEEQSAALKRLMDQSRVDASKTQEMLAQVLMLLQNDPTRCAAAAAAGGLNPSGDGDRAPVEPAGLTIDPEQLHAELADLHAELEVAVRNKNVTEEEYLDQIIMAISAVEEQLQGSGQQEAVPQPPVDLLCPITLKLLEDPVILVDSAQTYERGAIQEWLDRGNRKDPVSGVQLVSTTIVPNIAVRKMAQDWGQANPAYRRQQEEAASRAAAAAQRQQHSPAAEAAVAGKGELQAAAAEDECVSINPKTAAILSAGHQAGFDPSALCPVNGDSGTGPQDKEQQAYARAVAAAAAADSAAVVAMPAVTLSVPAGGMAGSSAAAFQADRQYSSDSSAGGDSRCSSITFARGASAQTLPRLFTPPAAVPEATDICRWPSQGPGRQQQQQSPGRQRQPSPRQQRQPSPQQQRQQSPRQQPQQQQRSPRGFSLPGNKSRQERAAAAAAAAAAVIAGQQKGGFQLKDLHGTLDRAAESRFAMSMRLRGPQAAEQVREASQQLRQEREVQRQAGQQQEECAYLQQHMERLMRDQAQQQQQQQQQPYPSNISSSVPLGGGWQQPAGMSHASSFPDLHSPAGSSQAVAQQQPGWGGAGGAAASSSSTGPSSPPNSGSYLPPRPASVQGDPRHAAMPPPQPDSVSSLPSSGSLLSRFRRSGQADAPPSSQCDDTASISSAGSSASRRSLRGLLGAVKSVKYAMVYDDTKV